MTAVARWELYRKGPGFTKEALAVFTSTKQYWDYVALMKEQHLFNTASIESAESLWGIDKYYVDRVALYTKEKL